MPQDEKPEPSPREAAVEAKNDWKVTSTAPRSRNRALWKRLDAAEQSARRLAAELDAHLHDIEQLNRELQPLADAPHATEKSHAAIAEALAKKAGKLNHIAKLAYDTSGALDPRRSSMGRLAGSVLRRFIGPRLGRPYQYLPRPLQPPPPYRPGMPNVERPGADKMPGIAIVTPSFRQGRFIETTLQSVVGQRYPALQYFVQDGGSQDETQDVLRQWSGRLTGWSSAPDNGQSHALNLGFAQVSGEIMAYLNSDDLLLPDALICVADYFARHPDIDVVYGNRLLINEDGDEIGRWVLPGHDDAAMCWADYIPQESLFWRRSIWERAGGHIDESFRFAMDWDLLMRFRAAGARFAHIPRFLGAFRIHADQKTSAEIQNIGFEEMNRIRKRVLGRVPDPVEIRKAVTPFMIRHILADARIATLRRLRLA